MLGDKQQQSAEEGSTAIQAGRDANVINFIQHGLTVSEARDIALDVAKSTFLELSAEGKITASIRAEEITNEVIKRLEQDFPEGLQKAKDPDFQYALYTVQKEYARNGDKDLGSLLVDLLVDRSKHDQRDFLQIVLNESLATAPKLTESHLAALAVIFVLKYTQNYTIGNHQIFGEYLDKHVHPFILKLSKSNAGYQHLQFSGCGSIEFGGSSLQTILGTTYQGQFFKGFDKDEITTRGISLGVDPEFFIPCLNNPEKYQIKANSKEILEEILTGKNIKLEDRSKMLDLFEMEKMNEFEIQEKLISIRPYMATLIDTWNNSPMMRFSLTSVGMAIGHANVKRLIGEFADLSIWIN